MTLREICETLGVSRRALQGYEKAGLVTASGRNKYGHLLYDKDAEMRIAQIKFYQQLGFTIKEITRIIDAPEAELRSALEQRVQKLREEKTEMDELIERANQIIARLSEKTASKKSYFESCASRRIVGAALRSALAFTGRVFMLRREGVNCAIPASQNISAMICSLQKFIACTYLPAQRG